MMGSFKKLVAASAVAGTLAIAGGAPALAFTNGGGNSGNAPGQQKAIENCFENIQKQTANGQTGAETGSENDSKQAFTAVTNCDHFWTP